MIWYMYQKDSVGLTGTLTKVERPVGMSDEEFMRRWLSLIIGTVKTTKTSQEIANELGEPVWDDSKGEVILPEEVK